MLDKNSEKFIILLFSPFLFLLSFIRHDRFVQWYPMPPSSSSARRWLRVGRPTTSGLAPRLPHVLVALRPRPPHAPTVSTPWPPCVPVALRLDHLDDSTPPRTNGSVPAPRPQGGASWGHVCKPRVSSESRKHGWRAKRPSAVLFDWRRDEAVPRVV
jgi:hypothetical protein